MRRDRGNGIVITMQQIKDWLKQLIDYNTTMDDGDTAACAAFIVNTVQDIGIQADIYKTACASGKPAHHVYASVPGRSRETILLHAHMDTASYDRNRSWHFHPDQGTEYRGCIFGRGALDCKSQIAVWMQLMADAAASSALTGETGTETLLLPYTLAMLVTDREEQGGEAGLDALMRECPELFEDICLVIGEGGGFPFPFRDRLYYTFQTGEREDEDSKSGLADPGPAGSEDSKQDRILQTGVDKGYYAPMILDYCRECGSIAGRRLDTEPLYNGMEEWFAKAPDSKVYSVYGDVFRKALQSEVPEAELMPCITPGYSDNRWFRKRGIPVIGFFPLDIRNTLSGIHGVDEYISERSLHLAYHVMLRILKEIRI
jgi:acetylornithine deacetylase/succinyl-diaminopimelate desuccinylase-like protein